MIKVCFGCGVKLQADKPENTGFIPPQKMDDSKYCQRCFKLIHYGKHQEMNTPKEVKQIINNINKDAKFVVFLTDLLSINSETIKIFKSIKGRKLFVISKSDIIPKSVKDATVRDFLKNYYGLNEDIKFVSSHTNFGVEALINYLNTRKIKETYIVGLSNAGKSNLINAMIEKVNPKLNKLTTSNTLNTTLEFIRIPLDDNLTIIDTPGFIMSGIKFKPFTIKGAIKPKIYQMKANETLKIENYYLSFSESTSAILYIPNEFETGKYYKEINFTEKIKINDNEDLIINGLGFIHIKKKCNIKLANIDLGITEVRSSIFGGFDE